MKTEFTRNEDHFVRSHGGIPIINKDDFFLEICGMVNQPKRLTMADPKNDDIFPRQSAVVTTQRSGTRRIEQIQVNPGGEHTYAIPDALY